MDCRNIFDLESLFRTPEWRKNSIVKVPGLQTIFYKNELWHGKETSVFAFLGLPKLKKGEKCPAVVLVHGGGGTAFHNWVELWNKRGYAAIAMDTCGCIPDITLDHHNSKWERHAGGGPGEWGRFDRQNRIPVPDAWMYHAVCMVIRAHSLLRSLPQVDSANIGLTGVSWGGTITCCVGGLDPRFAWCAPVYGCGFRDPKRMVYDPARFDPARYLRYAKMPFLFLNGTNDFTFYLNNWFRSVEEVAGPAYRCLRVNMPHGHGEVSENPPEIHDFAESVRQNREPAPEISAPVRSAEQVAVRYKTIRNIVRAEFNFTRATGFWTDRRWNITEAKLDEKTASAEIPPHTSACYFNLFDDNGLIYSSPVREKRSLNG